MYILHFTQIIMSSSYSGRRADVMSVCVAVLFVIFDMAYSFQGIGLYPKSTVVYVDTEAVFMCERIS